MSYCLLILWLNLFKCVFNRVFFFYFLIVCSCCNQYQKIGKILKKITCPYQSTNDGVRWRARGGIGIVVHKCTMSPFMESMILCLSISCLQVKFVPSVFSLWGMLSTPRVRTILTSSIPRLTTAISMTFQSFPWPNV